MNGRISLEGVGPSIQGLSWTFDRSVRIGRDHQLDIVLADPSVGRQHAEIRSSPRGWTIHDLGSSSGTFVNGVRVDGAGRKLQKDDLLQCGQLGLTVTEACVQKPSTSSLPAPADIKATGAMLRIQACSHLSWEEGLREQSLDRVAAHAKHFLALVRAGYHLSRIDAVPELLQSLLDDIVVALDAQRGAILLAEEDSALTLKTISGPRARDSGRNFSRTLADRCFRKADSLLCINAGLDRAASGVHDGMVSIICGLLRSPRKRLGVLHLDRGPLQEPFTEDDLRLVDAIAATAAVGIESALTVEKLQAGFRDEAAAMLLEALRLRDPATAEHCERVRAYALRLAAEVSLSAGELKLLPTAALLHDLGKLVVDDALLKKRGILTQRETEAVHFQGMIIAQQCAALEPVWPILRHCNEHWDGSGFPQGLKGQDIPKLTRLIAVADLFDEMTHPSSGNSRSRIDQQLANLAQESNRRLDPSMVAAALRVANDLLALETTEMAN